MNNSRGNGIIIGVDLGGTKIMTGAITREGKVLGRPVMVLTGAGDPAGIILQRITGSIDKTIHDLNLSTNDLVGIGIGSTGPVNSKTGEILECPQLPNMHFFNVREFVKNYFGIPVRLDNDANCLILGECIFGAAADYENVVGFTLGTGLGCAVVLHKKILNGSTGTAGEIWPSPYQSGTIEDFISGSGIARIYKSICGLEATSLEVFNLALAGNKDAMQTWQEFGAHLAVPLAWSINLIDPEAVIIGGSIASAYPFFKSSMEDQLRKWVCPVPAENTKVLPAKLGNFAGFIGAACLFLDDDPPK